MPINPLFNDFLKSIEVHDDDIAALVDLGVTDMPTFVFCAIDNTKFESDVVEKIKATTQASLGRCSKIRRAFAEAKMQNPSLLDKPLVQGASAAVMSSLDASMRVSDEYIESLRSKYKEDVGHDVFEVRDPSNLLVQDLLKEEQIKKYRVTIHSSMRTRTEERE